MPTLPIFEREYRALMRAKLGLAEVRDQDEELIREFLGLLQGSHADYTIVFREMGAFLSRTRNGERQVARTFSQQRTLR